MVSLTGQGENPQLHVLLESENPRRSTRVGGQATNRSALVENLDEDARNRTGVTCFFFVKMRYRDTKKPVIDSPSLFPDIHD